MNTVFKISDVAFSYGNGMVLKGINMSVQKGENIAILGPNGSGKTTLLRLLYKSLTPSKGTIKLFGKDKMSRKEISKKIAVVSKAENTSISFTVFEMIMMGRYLKSKGIWFENKEDKERARDIMKRLDIDRYSDKYFNCLSSGEQQRVLIGRALAQGPEVMLLDEPTSHLDLSHQVYCHSLFCKLNESMKITVVMVSHDLNLAAQFCKRIILIKDGSIYADGVPEDVLTEKNIEDVYGVKTIVDYNPSTSKPRITLIP
ncbi:MAG: ABC transporter ATP-binding protein [Candidatus Schekmanbacteria bacterium]|nr:MAG: ABC transporter ATP-binding protein [Candidatus Schekmanbacteria bacterium]